MLLRHYTIRLDPRTKKNHMRILGTGAKCPVCHKPARQFVSQSKAHDEYAANAVYFLRPKPQKPLEGPVHIKYHFYMQTKRKVDKTNLIAAIDDILVSEGIIVDDNEKVLKHHDGTRVFHDKAHPRTEIFIYEYKEEEDNERPEDFQN